MKRYIPLLVLTLCGGMFALIPQVAHAATLNSASDTLTTSRPSASAPLNVNQVTTDTSIQVVDNGSFYLASDSANFVADSAGETSITGTVASMSAQISGTPNYRIVFFTSALSGSTHHKGDNVNVPITAMHTIQFKTLNAIPASGKVILTFPGSANNTASPSASGFAFNGLDATGGLPTNIKTNGITCNTSSAVTSPTITCVASTSVSAGTTVTFLIGCTAASGASCTTQDPTLINPTKSQTAGTADNWKVNIQTQDASSNNLDSATVAVGTIESVQVQATVDPTLTFTIAGINNSTAINTGNTTGCTNTETTNTGIASTATSVNMGIIPSSAINIAAQLLTISTNAQNGYSLTATSSGHLINPSNGHWIPDNTTPQFMTAGTPFFGIHPCGLDVTATWASGATGGGAGAKYGWPTPTTAVTLASDSVGPIGNAITAGNGLVSVEYAGTVNETIPAGLYQSVITYVATPSF